MFRNLKISLILSLVCSPAFLHAAIVTPNPASLLTTKKILILDGANTSSHPEAKAAAEKMLHKLLDTLLHIPTANRVFAGTSLSQVTTANLAQYDIIVFNFYFETQLMTTAQQSAIKAWLALPNKGYVGYHTSGANEQNEWNWYRDSVTSMLYKVHSGSAQTGTINKTSDTAITGKPIMAGLPDTVAKLIDEWYTFGPGLTWGDTSNMNKNSTVRVMYYLQEKTLPTPLPDAMGTHPAAWYREDSHKTRYFYSIFTHDPIAAASDFFGSVMLRAMEYVAGYNESTPVVNGTTLRHKGAIALSRQDLKVQAEGPYRLQIWSMRGELVYSTQSSGLRSYHVEAFKNPGIYFAKVHSKAGVFTQKLMVQ